ncbi:MAG TPA: alanine racemase [Acidimicrobiales bacterium]|nr:alanine racemase [Acidimicrobiales bacterium]
MAERFRPAWVEVDLDALEANARRLAAHAAPAALCAVVKADAYGHGAVEAARALVAGGAAALAVALVEEGVALREAGIDRPVLVLAEPTAEAMVEAAARDLTLTVYRPEGVAAARSAARAARRTLRVHLKVDTGMHRLGADPGDVLELAAAVAAAPELELEGVYTHLATADAPDDPFTDYQLACFAALRAELKAAGLAPPVAHAANSAATIARRDAHLDWVRCGIACYGLAPSLELAEAVAAVGGLRPALSLKARVHLVRRLPAGSRPSYGRLQALATDSFVAVVPLGYYDGVPRALSRHGGEVLIGGRRRPIVGAVTMDQLLVDCGPAGDVAPGDEVVLLGRQGAEEVTAWEWAQRLSTIAYEVLCGIGPRVPRRALRSTGGGGR